MTPQDRLRRAIVALTAIRDAYKTTWSATDLIRIAREALDEIEQEEPRPMRVFHYKTISQLVQTVTIEFEDYEEATEFCEAVRQSIDEAAIRADERRKMQREAEDILARPEKYIP